MRLKTAGACSNRAHATNIHNRIPGGCGSSVWRERWFSITGGRRFKSFSHYEHNYIARYIVWLKLSRNRLPEQSAWLRAGNTGSNPVTISIIKREYRQLGVNRSSKSLNIAFQKQCGSSILSTRAKRTDI